MTTERDKTPEFYELQRLRERVAQLELEKTAALQALAKASQRIAALEQDSHSK